MDNGKISWTDFRVPVENSPVRDPSNTAVVSQVGQDSRKWNYLHYSAVTNPQIIRHCWRSVVARMVRSKIVSIL